MSERRIRNNKRRRERELRRHILLSVLTLCITVAFVFCISSINTDAKDSSETIEIKYYTSMTVSAGDTLWTIAAEHMGESGHYASASEYITEVMRMNGLDNETIYAGQHLVIPYYSAEFIQ